MSDDLPKICEAGLEFVILFKDLEYHGIIEHVLHKVTVFNDGSVFAKEVLSRAAKDETLSSTHAHNYKEFAEKFPKDAKIIDEFVAKHNIIIPWVNGGN